MEFLNKLDLSGKGLLKIAGIIFLGLVVFMVVISGLNSARYAGIGGLGMNTSSSMPSAPRMYESDTAEFAPTLSMRNAMMPPEPGGGYTTGDDAEAFEVKEYNASIETRDLERDCGSIRALKSRTDVIFEQVSEYERGCNFTFKVKKGSVEEVLSILKELDPRELNETSYTIKREVDDYTSEIQILEGKLASYDTTLGDAIASYENITALATRVGDVESLAKVIESKITIIERLTSLRISTANELERMHRAKAEALDRLEYTYFSVTVYENKFADGTVIKDSWKGAVQQFVRDSNELVQELSIGLVTFLLLTLKFVIYFLIIVFVARFGWTFVKKVWGTGAANEPRV